MKTFPGKFINFLLVKFVKIPWYADGELSHSLELFVLELLSSNEKDK